MKRFEQIASRDIKPGDVIAYNEHGETDIVEEIRLDVEDDEISLLYRGTLEKRREMNRGEPVDRDDCWWGPVNGEDPALREIVQTIELDDDETMLLLITKHHEHKDVPRRTGESMMEYVQRCCNFRCFGTDAPSVPAGVFTIYLELCQKLLSPFAFCEVLKRIHSGFWWRESNAIRGLAPLSQADLVEAMLGQLSIVRVDRLVFDESLMVPSPETQPRVHFQASFASAGTPLCQQTGKQVSVTLNPSNVTCKRCQHLMAEQPEPDPKLLEAEPTDLECKCPEWWFPPKNRELKRKTKANGAFAHFATCPIQLEYLSELHGEKLQPQTCTREPGHESPCNGYPRQDCLPDLVPDSLFETSNQ